MLVKNSFETTKIQTTLANIEQMLFYCLVKRAFYDKWGLYTALTP